MPKKIFTADQNANVVTLRQAKGREYIYHKPATAGEPSKLKGFTYIYRSHAGVLDYYIKNEEGCCDE